MPLVRQTDDLEKLPYARSRADEDAAVKYRSKTVSFCAQIVT